MKRKEMKDKRATISKEVGKLKEVGFIREIKYSNSLANIVMMDKTSKKWWMYVDFTDLNKSYPKDQYPLLIIDRLIDDASEFLVLSFMDAYSGYNQIRINPTDTLKKKLMNNHNKLQFEVMSFDLKTQRRHIRGRWILFYLSKYVRI